MPAKASPKILFGPYGTRLEEIGRTIGEPNLNDPVAILNGPECRKAVVHVAQDYIYSGANVGTVNGFGLRGLLHNPGQTEKYNEVLQAQAEALLAAINGFGQRIEMVVSLGPQNDCYEPDLAPTALEAEDFHGQQLAAASKLDADLAWFETVNTSREAIGIAKAAKRREMETIISFVLSKDGRLLSGQTLADAIKEVDSATNRSIKGYSVNCCPIEAIDPALKQDPVATNRVIAAYANSTSVDQRTFSDLDEVVGVREPSVTASYMHYLAKRYSLATIGGCCGFTGSDVAHINRCIHRGIAENTIPKR